MNFGPNPSLLLSHHLCLSSPSPSLSPFPYHPQSFLPNTTTTPSRSVKRERNRERRKKIIKFMDHRSVTNHRSSPPNDTFMDQQHIHFFSTDLTYKEKLQYTKPTPIHGGYIGNHPFVRLYESFGIYGDDQVQAFQNLMWPEHGKLGFW